MLNALTLNYFVYNIVVLGSNRRCQCYQIFLVHFKACLREPIGRIECLDIVKAQLRRFAQSKSVWQSFKSQHKWWDHEYEQEVVVNYSVDNPELLHKTIPKTYSCIKTGQLELCVPHPIDSCMFSCYNGTSMKTFDRAL